MLEKLFNVKLFDIGLFNSLCTSILITIESFKFKKFNCTICFLYFKFIYFEWYIRTCITSAAWKKITDQASGHAE